MKIGNIIKTPPDIRVGHRGGKYYLLWKKCKELKADESVTVECDSGDEKRKLQASARQQRTIGLRTVSCGMTVYIFKDGKPRGK